MNFIQGNSRILSRISSRMFLSPDSGSGSPKPVIFNSTESVWLQLENLKLGDILSIHTESSHYQFVIVGRRCGFLVSSNEDVPAGLYFLHGASVLNANLDASEPVVYWGTLQVGAMSLFANVDAPTAAFRTSKVVKLGLVRAGTYNSPYAVTTPLPPFSGSAPSSMANKPSVVPSGRVGSNPVPLGVGLKPLGSLGPNPRLATNVQPPKPVVSVGGSAVPARTPLPINPQVKSPLPKGYPSPLGAKVLQSPKVPNTPSIPRPAPFLGHSAAPKPSEFVKPKPL